MYVTAATGRQPNCIKQINDMVSQKIKRHGSIAQNAKIIFIHEESGRATQTGRSAIHLVALPLTVKKQVCFALPTELIEATPLHSVHHICAHGSQTA